MKKSLSGLSLVLLVAFSVWQYWQDSKTASRAPKSAVQNSKVFQSQADNKNFTKNDRTLAGTTADYDVSLAQDSYGQNQHAPVDYYMLALSWSPDFCQQQYEKFGENLPHSAQYQCGVKRQFGWVVHGLWPQNARAKSIADHPRFCQGDLPPLPQELLQPYLSMSPGEKLLQGEWEKHGACAFDSAQAYFNKMQQLYQALNLPKEKPNRKELFRLVKANNPALRNVFLGASGNELYICYDLQFQPINCPN